MILGAEADRQISLETRDLSEESRVDRKPSNDCFDHLKRLLKNLRPRS